VNRKKIQRLWREEGLRVPQRNASGSGSASPPCPPSGCGPSAQPCLGLGLPVRHHQRRPHAETAPRRRRLQNGFHATSLDTIADEAGYTKGAVYSNFDSKEDVFVAVYERRAARGIAEYEREIAAAAAGGTGLEALALAAVRFVVEGVSEFPRCWSTARTTANGPRAISGSPAPIELTSIPRNARLPPGRSGNRSRIRAPRATSTTPTAASRSTIVRVSPSRDLPGEPRGADLPTVPRGTAITVRKTEARRRVVTSRMADMSAVKDGAHTGRGGYSLEAGGALRSSIARAAPPRRKE
jgi:AcrR family transcriptional regulator